MTVSVAVVGAGWWATRCHLPSLRAHPGAELVAVCDRDAARAQEVAAAFGADRWGTDVADLIEGPGRVDALVVATPHATHHALVAAALDAGVHVLVEKTMAVTADEAWDLVARSERSGAHLSVGYTYQYTSTAKEVRSLVSSGDVGDVVQVVAEFSSSTQAMFAGVPSGPNGQGPVDAGTYGAGGGGGQAHTQATHVLGCVLWTLGHGVAEVSAFMDRRGLEVDVVDSAAMRFDGGGSGVLASTGTLGPGQPARHRITWYGTRATVEQDLLGARALVHGPTGTRTIAVPPDRPTYPVLAPAHDFVDLVSGDGPNNAPGVPAAQTVSAIEAMHLSALEGSRQVVATRPQETRAGQE